MPTTAPSTPCSKNWLDPQWVWRIALAWLITCVASTALAQNASVVSARLEATDEGWQVNADLELSLAPTLFDAVRKGVPVYFVAEFELTRARWYWIDQTLAAARRERRLSFAPLTDQYRVLTSGISQNLATAEDVTKLLARIRSWTVADKGQLKAGVKYDAALRFRLDAAQLPKPFQLNVLTAREWSVSTDWYRWTVSP